MSSPGSVMIEFKGEFIWKISGGKWLPPVKKLKKKVYMIIFILMLEFSHLKNTVFIAIKFRVENRPKYGSIWGGYGNPPQYSCLENPIDRGAWQATVHGDCTESDTDEVTYLAHMHAWLYITNRVYLTLL